MNKLISKKKIETKATITRCAESLFINKGYLETDMNDIATMAGITKRTIYRYFPTKEALGFSIWTNVVSSLLDIGFNAKGSNGYDKIENALALYIESIFNNKDKVKFLGEFDHTFSGKYPDIIEAKDFVSYIKSRDTAIFLFLKEGIEDKSIAPEVNIELLSNTISNIMLSLSQRVVIRGEHLKIEQGHSDELLNESVRIILRGIKA